MSLGDVKINPLSFVPKSARKEFERTGLSSLLGQTVLMLFLLVIYVTPLVALNGLIPDALEDLESAVGQGVFYSFAVVPIIVILLFSTVPTVLRARRQYRLNRRKFAWETGSGELFRLHPYGAADRDAYERPGGEHDKVVNWLTATPHSVNYLCGLSGAGKSSLVQASLLPRLEKAGWRTAVVRVDVDPVERIRQAVLSVPNLMQGEEVETLSLANLLEAISRRIGRIGQPPLLIVIDQFEEFLILNEAADRQPLSDILRRLDGSPLKGVRLLLVFRSDYRELLFKLNLPRFLSTENAFELAAFYRGEAQGFLVRGGLAMSEIGFDALFQGLDRIEGRPGLYRPITLNMVGLVMKRTPSGQIKEPSRLIEFYLRHCLADGVSQDLAPGVLACMITAEGTKEPRRLADIASLTRLRSWEVEATLSEMESAGLVRSISADRGDWEISHDFLARQIGFLLGRLRQPRLQRYATPVLATVVVSWTVTIAVAVFLVWPELKEDKALDGLAKIGFSRTAESGRHALILQKWDVLTDVNFARFGQLIANLSDSVVDVRLRNTGITDLSPLEGMALTQLDLSEAEGITDLSPLKGMPLAQLELRGVTGITDLSPLEGMALTYIGLSETEGITDLSPLEGMPLAHLDLSETEGITDLSPLEGMALTSHRPELGRWHHRPVAARGHGAHATRLRGVGITDLSPLEGMALAHLDLRGVIGIRPVAARGHGAHVHRPERGHRHHRPVAARGHGAHATRPERGRWHHRPVAARGHGAHATRPERGRPASPTCRRSRAWRSRTSA